MGESAWRLLHDGPADGPWNMAVDEAIAQAVGEGRVPATLRFYRWKTPTVSLGYLQRMPGGVSLPAIRRLAIPLVRRVTGGRAVLHADELTYSVALPLRGPWCALSVPEAFTLICRGLIAGLRRLEIAASVGEAGDRPRDGRETDVCFLGRRTPAVLVGGRKLIGSAQRRWDRSLLQHGSLLLDFDSGLHQTVFPAWPQIDPAGGVTCLQSLLGGVPPIIDLVTFLVAGWCDAFGDPCVSEDLTRVERMAAADLARARYASPAWTFRR